MIKLIDYIIKLVENWTESPAELIAELRVLRRVLAKMPNYHHDDIIDAFMGGNDDAE